MGSCRWWKWLISAGFAGLLAACAGTGGLRPQSSLRGADSLAASRTVAAADVAMGEWPRVDWWKQFNDPQLDTLIERGLTGSPSLGIAAARVREALAAAMSERAPLFPRIDGDFESVRQRLSDTGVVSPALAGADWITQTQLETTLKYELDFWGRNRAAYESALGRERAAEVDAFASRLTLSASIALAYARLQHAYLLLDVANATLEQREAVLRLTRQRVGAGLDSRLELKQAEAALPEARERIAQLRGAIGIERDELAALIGE